MPASAAATLSNTAWLIGLMPRMSIDRVNHHHILGADERAERRCPEAMGVTMIFGHADWQAHHRARAEHGAFGATDRRHAVESSLTVEI